MFWNLGSPPLVDHPKFEGSCTFKNYSLDVIGVRHWTTMSTPLAIDGQNVENRGCSVCFCNLVRLTTHQLSSRGCYIPLLKITASIYNLNV